MEQTDANSVKSTSQIDAKQFIEFDDNFKDKIYTKLQRLPKEHTIVLFLGNGISSKDLNTNKLVLDFFADIRESDPRQFSDYSSSCDKLLSLIRGIGIEYNITDLMEDLSRIDSLRDKFAGFLIKKCCESFSNLNHYYILLIIYLLKNYPEKKWKVVVFTVNYDNLLEKEYYRIKEFIDKDPSSQIGLPLKPIKDIFTEIGRPILVIPLKTIQNSEGKFYKPSYVLTETDFNSSRIPIAPINGSVRVSKCTNCDTQLQTEAAAVQNQVCTRCGKIVSSIILPLKEGTSDKSILALFENIVRKSSLVIFIGYNFDDPHVNYKLEQGTINYGEGLKIVELQLFVNLLNKKMRDDVKKNFGKNTEVYEFENDIQKGLLSILSAFELIFNVVKTNFLNSYLTLRINEEK